MHTYRVDWAQDDDALTDPPHVIFCETDRKAAQRHARRISAKHRVAYLIASKDGRDTGQLVYEHGRESYMDGLA